MASTKEVQTDLHDTNSKGDVERRGSVARTEKGRWERLWPVIACGAGLFSDGYLNNVRNYESANLPCDIPDPERQYVPSRLALILTITPDYRTCQHHVEDDLPEGVHELIGTSQCSQHHVCRHGRRNAVFRLHV